MSFYDFVMQSGTKLPAIWVWCETAQSMSGWLASTRSGNGGAGVALLVQFILFEDLRSNMGCKWCLRVTLHFGIFSWLCTRWWHCGSVGKRWSAAAWKHDEFCRRDIVYECIWATAFIYFDENIMWCQAGFEQMLVSPAKRDKNEMGRLQKTR